MSWLPSMRYANARSKQRNYAPLRHPRSAGAKTRRGLDAEDNLGAADALLAAAASAARTLSANPLLGRVRPELASEQFRFWPLRGFPYVLVYDATRQPIVIVRSVHQFRDLPTVLDEGR